MNYVHTFIAGYQYFFGCYTLAMLLFALTLVLASFRWFRGGAAVGTTLGPEFVRPYEPGITIISPAFNEASTIMRSITSLLSLNYPECEIVVVNDGSTDDTVGILVRALDLYPVSEPLDSSLPTKPIRTVYRSRLYPDFRLIDKENGGKADALNAGINAAYFSLVCTLDADTILPQEALTRLVRPFGEVPGLVAAGGMVRLINGCECKEGRILKVRLPRNALALFQVIEYLRAFMYGRIGWRSFGALLIISGAFGLFKKDALIAIGGYQTDTIGEDMELIVRMHRIYSARHEAYRIEFVPDAICWTEAPEDIRSLRNQRIRWQRGLGESLFKNRALLFSLHGGVAGWVACPFYLVFELLGPLIELTGIIIVILAYLLDVTDAVGVAAFLIMILGVSLFISTLAFLMDDSALGRRAQSPLHILVFLLLMLPETLFYRIPVNYWRTIGLLTWVTGKKGGWGEIRRLAPE
jgi:cellulose synthase/poly-beta-1,6-N-acetylglucosamine synthase-like glycosyltransferase